MNERTGLHPLTQPLHGPAPEGVYINETVLAVIFSNTGTAMGRFSESQIQHPNGATLPYLPEDKGLLRFLPFDDDAYHIQLFLTLEGDEQDPESTPVFSLQYLPAFLSQWPVAAFLKEKAFARDECTDLFFEISASILRIATALCTLPSANALQHTLAQTERAVTLLRAITDQINLPFAACPVPACRFLAYDTEREKIFNARAILDAEYDESISVKALARRVAMNECYLKKGFKTLIGRSIHEYQLWRRMEAARELLAAGKNVTTVSALLGFGSISHFSTAFKKATGLKPCELLG